MLSFIHGILRETTKATFETLGFEFSLSEMPYHLAMSIIGTHFEHRYKRRLNYQESFEICSTFSSVEVNMNDLCALCGRVGAKEYGVHQECVQKIHNIVMFPLSKAGWMVGFAMGAPTGMMPKVVLDGLLELNFIMQSFFMGLFGEKEKEAMNFINFSRTFREKFAGELYSAMANSPSSFLRGMFKGARLHRFIKEPKQDPIRVQDQTS